MILRFDLLFAAFEREREREMELKLLLVELLMILCFWSLQAFAGLRLQSLSEASSSVFPINVKSDTDLQLYESRHGFLLLENDHVLSPASAHEAVPEYLHHHKTYRAPSPSHHLLPKDSNPQKPNSQIPSVPSFTNPTKNRAHSPPSSSPVDSMRNYYQHSENRDRNIAPEPYHHRHHHHRNPSRKGSGISPSSKGWISKKPLPAIPSNRVKVPSPSPSAHPTSSHMKNNDKSLPPLPSLVLPPPPTNQGCASVKCIEPLTYAAHGAPCACVLPIEVSLRFRIPLYNFFPLVPELSREIADAISLDRSQVRILGADASDHQLEKTTVLINLVPLQDKFDVVTSFSIYEKFWTREIKIKNSLFGAYEVMYVHYQGLPPSPPLRPDDSASIDSQPYIESNNDVPLKPLGVDITRQRKNNSDRNMIIVVVLSSVTAFVVILGFIMLSLSKRGCFEQKRQDSVRSDNRQSDGRLVALRSKPSSGSMSFSSGLVASAGLAKVFTLYEIEKATDEFSASRVLGEGGFGIVYGGVLEDGRNVAVKVLKRDNKQGSREFLAEVEMLSRLHHRNLVKLIGICAEEQFRCLVYELVPNGSVESHLHGAEKEIAPLDWDSRMKIALGAARGLAYLHEDSSPRVIHRDFKSSNILLEHDYTPKVSDFGLARTAMEEENKPISTHVMGTFGYLAPEYAMTGHVLVKSDVYSYGVVLLELLTGRKPVDLTQPQGQENLVSWARPLLTTNDGLEAMVDPVIKPHVPLENLTRVAAIASMCVQPEVSHRPFMGEVVQALKLVCDEIEETKNASRGGSRGEISYAADAGAESSRHSRITSELLEDLEREERCLEDLKYEDESCVSDVDLKSKSSGGGGVVNVMMVRGQESESFRRQFNSAPLKMIERRKRRFWERLRRFSRGSMSDHEYLTRL